MKKILLGTSVLMLAACNTNGTEPTDENDTLSIYTSIFPLQDWTEKIGGEFVNVENVIPAGADAHTFEPTAQGLVDVANADAFIYNGAGLEGFADTIISTVSSQDVTVVEAINGIDLLNETDADHAHHHDEEDDHGHEGHSHGDEDPHVWLDPVLADEMAQNILVALVDQMPEQEAYFQQNYEDLSKQFAELDEAFEVMTDQTELNTILVSHAGYGYWEERYGIQQLGISGISPTSEPSQRELEETVRRAEELGVQHVLFEPNISPRVTEVVQQEIGAKALTIYNLEGLTEAQEQSGDDYFSIMTENVETLRTALSISE